MRSSLKRAGPIAFVALLALLILPASALATETDLKQAIDGTLDDTIPINTMWVVIAAVFVLFMQAGFAMLEIGFSRAKNAGTGVAKILTNLSIAAICYWAVGFAFAFGSAGRARDLERAHRLERVLPAVRGEPGRGDSR